MSVPRVFISYSHDSKRHKLWVLKLATQLQERGIDVHLDQWDVDLGDDLPRFMEKIVKTDRVLMICTENYVNRCNEGEKGGVPLERRLMSGQLMQGRPLRTFIQIMRDNQGGTPPDFIGGGAFYSDFNDDDRFDEKLWELAASIHGARVKKPPIGRNPFEKGIDAAFGINGIQILRDLNLKGFRLTFENEFYYVSAMSNEVGSVVKVAINGEIYERFGENGLLSFPMLQKNDQYGLSLYDFYYLNDRLYQITPDMAGSLPFSLINNNETIEVLEPDSFVLAMVTANRQSGSFRIRDERMGIVIFGPPGTNQGYRFFETESDSVRLQWGRAKTCGDFLYLFGKRKGPERGNRPCGIQRYRMDGTFDHEFGQNGLVTLKGGPLFAHHANDIIELADGRIVAVGSGNEAAVACLLPNGKLDPDFGSGGYLQFRAAARSAAKFVDEYEGRIVLSGIESDGRSIQNCFVAMLQTDGRSDNEFGLDGAISVTTGSRDEILDVYVGDGKATILFQHDREAEIRPRIGLARVHLA